MNAALQAHDGGFDSRARAFARIHTATDTSAFASNIHATVTLLEADRSYPMTQMTQYLEGEAWVCSPCSAYGDYAIEELQRFGDSAAIRPLAWLCGGLNRWLRAAQFDRAVTINNWLLSTNLYPNDASPRVELLRDAAIAAAPSHSVWLRSLNARHNAAWLSAAKRAGFELIPSRQVYLIDEPRDAIARHANLDRDLRLLDRTSLLRSRGGFETVDYEAMATLYAQLYLDKYSHLNPQYTASFLQAWHRAGLLEIEALRESGGRMCAVVATFALENTVTAPIVGYDTALPQSRGLYRMLMASVVAAAIERGRGINFSAGAAEFKRLRGATAEIEYSAVYCAHLPKWRRRAVGVVRTLAERVGVPFMRKYRL
jgi:Acetyltransferase (GNAT) domain